MPTLYSLSERALIARVNRRLAHDGIRLCLCRYDSRWYRDLGRYYSVNANNFCCDPRFDDLDDLVEWAREEHILRSNEVIQTD